jgi:hypothetical protein
MTCWLARFGDGPCDGPMDRAHLVPRQRIRRQLHGQDPELVQRVIWHPSCWVWACRRHHGDFDNKRFAVPREALPECVEVFAAELGMLWSLEVDFDRQPGVVSSLNRTVDGTGES